MTILDKIIARKAIEVAEAKRNVAQSVLEKGSYFDKTTVSLQANLSRAGVNIIAEFKRKSPSKGIINDHVSVSEVAAGYAQAGAAGLSVLTDTEFFGGTPQDLLFAREACPHTPLLRKDFMIDPYQLYEAKAWGADVVLLIAANLSPTQVFDLAKTARSLGLETLLEVHDAEELDRSLNEYISIVGVNNRNLKNFAEQNVNASLALAEKIPTHLCKISESCIASLGTIKTLQNVGYDGFLIGETFMKTPNPAGALQGFLKG